jgi:hypothetical protein
MDRLRVNTGGQLQVSFVVGCCFCHLFCIAVHTPNLWIHRVQQQQHAGSAASQRWRLSSGELGRHALLLLSRVYIFVLT